MEDCTHEDSQSGGGQLRGDGKSSRADRLLIYAVIPLFIWVGFVLSISFMEAWLKFQAPQVTLAIGLGIGKLIFQALNRVEWLLAAITGFILFKAHTPKKAFFYIPISILMLQTFFLLPTLNERADAIAAGATLAPSFVHVIYLVVEVVKVVTLFVLGVSFFTQKN